MAQNLMEGLLEELNRCRDLKVLYDDLPKGAGAIGGMLIGNEIAAAEKAIADSDTIQMIASYQALKNLE